MNKYIVGVIIAIILLISGILIGKYYFSKTDIKIVTKEVTKTEYKYKFLPTDLNDVEKCKQAFDCSNSSINFKEKIVSNTLSVTAYDSCKEATAQYQIGTKGNWKIYVGVGAVGIAAGSYLTYKYFKK
jgi:hypothetical protein